MFRNNLLLFLDTISICLISGLRSAQTLENIVHIKAVSQSSTYLSLTEHEANKAVDGYTFTFAHGDRETNSLNWWKAELLSVYHISQVILTPRQEFNEPGRMDYVFIGISNSPNISGKVEYPVYPLCRQSPYKVHKTYDTFQNISCRANTPPGRYVFVQQPTTSPGYLTISEIQVYGIRLENDSLGNSTCQGNYYGENCDKYCNCDKGVKCDQQGICPNGCDVNWEGGHCDKRRFNDNQLMGCFQYVNSSTHEFYQLDSHGCIDTCSGYGFTYAANLTNTSCICTNTLNWTKSTNFEFCRQQCSSQSCESVFYSVCPNGTYGYNCTLKCNCLNNGRCSYMEGRCEDGCASGWTGASCDIRNCSMSNGACGENENCTSNSSGVTSCQCINGYNRTSEWLPCESLIVCPNGTYGYDCTLKCNCLSNGRCSYKEGRCEDGCASGWTGASCDIRDCSVSNGACGENENCTSNSSAITSCQCINGYNRTSEWLPCKSLLQITNTANKSTSAIIGGVIGSIAGLGLIIALILLFVKFRKRVRVTELTSSLFEFKRTNHDKVESMNNTSAFSERRFKLDETQKFTEENILNYVDEYQKLNLFGKSHLMQSMGHAANLNRFKNIVPYDHNRVKLIRKPNENQSDYINASYIQGIIEDVLIAAQGPVKNSVDDFWKMIWQQSIGIVIMLCNYVEHKKVKCEQYLPQANNLKAGEYTVHKKITIPWPSFRMEEFQISNGDQQRSLIHLHFTEWPDHGVPNNIFYLLDFCRRCQKLYEREKCGVLVHCSAGVGRTGSFLAIYDLLVKGHQGLDLSVPETVNNLRKQRMKMVEKQAQYNFIYEVLIEEAKLGPTCFSKDEFTKYYKTLKDGFLESVERSNMLYQHQILCKFYSNNENEEEVRFIKIITSAYNFCLMTNDTSSITWQNIPDTQCIIIFDPTMRSNIIPKVGHPIINGQVCISLVNETNSEWGKVFEVQKKGDNVSNYENVVVNAYDNLSTSKDNILRMCLVDKKEDYLDFLTFMELFSQLPKDANIAVILGNNHKLGYYFVAACNIISHLNFYDEIAILQNLCELCKITEYQPSQSSFEKLHQIVCEFILTSA